MFSFPPTGKSWAKYVSLALSCVTLEEDDVSKVKLPLNLFSGQSCFLFLFFFYCSNGVFNFSAGLLDFQKDSLIHGDCLNQCSLGR